MTLLTGGCACGRVRYRIKDEPLFTLACHCLDCQRTTGSAFVIHSVVPREDFEVEGETRTATVPSGGGAGCDLTFCSECGTYISARYRYHQVPVIAVRSGTLDDTSAVAPQAHIFTRSKQPWLNLPEDVPAFQEAFERDQVWPADNVARYQALAAGV